jgi:hypothetical protein
MNTQISTTIVATRLPNIQKKLNLKISLTLFSKGEPFDIKLRADQNGHPIACYRRWQVQMDVYGGLIEFYNFQVSPPKSPSPL